MCRVIGVVVDGNHGAYAIESLDEHAFWIKIGEAKGALYLIHATLASPFFYCCEECVSHLFVIDEVDLTKTYTFLVPCRIGLVVNDGDDASYYLAVA